MPTDREKDLQAEIEHLRGHDARLAAIVESSEDAIIGKSIDGIVESWNEGAEHLYGYTAAEMIGRPMELLLPPSRADEEREIIARIRRGERVEHFESLRLRKDGASVAVSLTISPIRNLRGEIIGASHIARDIGERVRQENALVQLAAIVESSEDAIVGKNLDGMILSWNRAAERVYGYTSEEAVGRSMLMLVPPERTEEEIAILQQIRRGERAEPFETVRIRRDGKPVHVSLTISPIRDRNGKFTGASHIARDITDRKRFDAQLQQTQKLEGLGVLAGGIAHDFNNLLTGILGNASLSLDLLPPSNPARSPMTAVMKAAERAAALTRQLLAYAGRGRLVTAAIDLSELVREISGLIEASIPKKVQLRLNLGTGLPVVEADSAQLQQVIMNLVINGAEAIGDSVGAVIVRTWLQDADAAYIRTVFGNSELRPGKYVALEVHDTGSGMDEETRAKIFDPFFSTKFAGRGLGLAAVLGIIRGHNGAIKVYSAPGEGSTFKILLPAAGQSASELKSVDAAKPARGQGTILVVDDEEVVREFAKAALEHYGYRVLLANNGQQAVERFAAESPAIRLVLLDHTMPVMGGEEAFRRIRMIRSDVPVLLSSGFNESEALNYFSGKGLAGFLQKPCTVRQLVDKISGILNSA